MAEEDACSTVVRLPKQNRTIRRRLELGSAGSDDVAAHQGTDVQNPYKALTRIKFGGINTFPRAHVNRVEFVWRSSCTSLMMMIIIIIIIIIQICSQLRRIQHPAEPSGTRTTFSVLPQSPGVPRSVARAVRAQLPASLAPLGSELLSPPSTAAGGAFLVILGPPHEPAIHAA